VANTIETQVKVFHLANLMSLYKKNVMVLRNWILFFILFWGNKNLYWYIFSQKKIIFVYPFFNN